jgi:hypothetical protein
VLRRELAELVLHYLSSTPPHRGKYRIARTASKLLDGVPIRSAYGPWLHTRFSDSTFWLAARFGYDEVMQHLSDLSHEDGFIDVGANIGLITCFAAERCSAVLSLEPSARELAELLRNCGLLSATACQPVCLASAASDTPGFASFRINQAAHSGGNSLGSTLKESDRQTTVPVLRLDDLFNDTGLAGWPAMHTAWQRSRLVIKIDVEGFESGVIRGMTGLLREKRFRKVIIELNRSRAITLSGGDDTDQIMRNSGYTPLVDPGSREHHDQCYIPTVMPGR